MSIRFISQRLNEDLENIIAVRWFSPFSVFDLSIIDVDGVDQIVKPDYKSASTVLFSFTRNQTARPVTFGYLLQPKINYFIFLAIFLFLLLLIANRFLPGLSRDQFVWRSRLLDDGYGVKKCEVLLSNYAESLNNLTSVQRIFIERLYDAKRHNFEAVLMCVVDSRLSRATELDLEWLIYSLSYCENEEKENVKAKEIAEKAVAIATASDTVRIDLACGALNIRGIEIQLTKTPLFYYAWYAMRRKKDDGWYFNPPSNKPDSVVGKGIADLMWRYNGHAKAISDLDEQGLKAKTLDQNRSKIKDELVSVLGATLAGHYLFESRKDAASGRLAYRFKPEADQVNFVE
ncbi:MAG: hypothetical protein K6L75_09135 [Cellvibrionaceae bacterium]